MSNETLIRCCAPTMACLKTGNMFSCGFESREQMTMELRQLNQRLRRKGLRILPLRWQNGRALLYLYRPRLLERDLRDPLAQRLLAECGYDSGSISLDVDGFMHRKEHYKFCGLWKVYDDVEGAIRKFERCRRCTEVYLRRYAQGYTLERLAVAG